MVLWLRPAEEQVIGHRIPDDGAGTVGFYGCLGASGLLVTALLFWMCSLIGYYGSCGIKAYRKQNQSGCYPISPSRQDFHDKRLQYDTS
jgi:hypothetical protein